MKILLIDTCGETGSVALAEDGPGGKVIASAELPGRTASERLLPTMGELASRAAVRPNDLGAIVVVHGPGSFTGVRVGVSAAKGLSEALTVPVVAISRLEVLAYQAHENSVPVSALLDAGRGEVYCGLYEHECLRRELLLSRAEAIDAARGMHLVVCRTDAPKLAGAELTVVVDPTAAAALPIALRRIAARQFVDVATLDANYLRRTDAEIFAKPQPARTSL